MLASHDEVPRATVATLLLDCKHLRQQLAVAESSSRVGHRSSEIGGLTHQMWTLVLPSDRAAPLPVPDSTSNSRSYIMLGH